MEIATMFHRHISQRTPPSQAEVSEARFKRFVRQLETYERKLAFDKTLDAFLDVYSLWKKTHRRSLKLRLVMLAFELHRLDRHFQCDLSFPDLPECERSSSEV